MKGRTVVMAVTPLIAFAPPSAAQAACAAPNGYKVIARSSGIVAFAPYKRFTSRQALVCSPQSGRRTYLAEIPYANGPNTNQQYVVAAAGRFLAYPYDVEEGADFYASGVKVVDARTGAARDLEFINYGSSANVSRIVVTAKGAVAWSEFHKGRQLWACLQRCTRSGSRRSELAHGHGLDMRSLVARGDHIYWRFNGVWRSKRTGG